MYCECECSNDSDNDGGGGGDALLCKSRIGKRRTTVCDFSHFFVFAIFSFASVASFCEYSISLLLLRHAAAHTSAAHIRNSKFAFWHSFLLSALSLRSQGKCAKFVQILICGCFGSLHGIFELFSGDFFISVFWGFLSAFSGANLPGRHGLVADPNDDFNCEKPAN